MKQHQKEQEEKDENEMENIFKNRIKKKKKKKKRRSRNGRKKKQFGGEEENENEMVRSLIWWKRCFMIFYLLIRVINNKWGKGINEKIIWYFFYLKMREIDHISTLNSLLYIKMIDTNSPKNGRWWNWKKWWRWKNLRKNYHGKKRKYDIMKWDWKSDFLIIFIFDD